MKGMNDQSALGSYAGGMDACNIGRSDYRER